MAKNCDRNTSLEISSDISNIEQVENFTVRFAKKIGMPDDKRDDLVIAVSELINNAIIHGNKLEKSKKVSICCSAAEHKVTVIVADEGKGFDPDNVDCPIDPDNILKNSGRGVFLLNKLMDSVDFSFTKEGTRITIIMKF